MAAAVTIVLTPTLPDTGAALIRPIVADGNLGNSHSAIQVNSRLLPLFRGGSPDDSGLLPDRRGGGGRAYPARRHTLRPVFRGINAIGGIFLGYFPRFSPPFSPAFSHFDRRIFRRCRGRFSPPETYGCEPIVTIDFSQGSPGSPKVHQSNQNLQVLRALAFETVVAAPAASILTEGHQVQSGRGPTWPAADCCR